MKQKILLFVLSFLFVTAFVIAETECGNSLTSSLTLTDDLKCPATALTIEADNVVLDCANHHITYASDNAGYAVNNSNGYDNITIKNCYFHEGNGINSNQQSPAVHFFNSQSSKILNNNISTTGRYSAGIELMNSDSNFIMNNIIFISGGAAEGIKITYGSNSNIIDNNIIKTRGGSGFGMYFYSSSNFNKVTNNQIDAGEQKVGTTSHGIYLVDSNSNYFENNRINTYEDFGHGIFFESSSSNSLINNKVITIGKAYGLLLRTASKYNILLNNTIKAEDFTIFDNTKEDFENYLIYTNPHGQISWSKKDLTTGIDLSIGETILLEPNLVGLVEDSNALSLNGSAKIAFFSILYPKLPWLLKDGHRCDHTSNCVITYYNFEDGILKADVSSSGRYSTLFVPTVWHYPNVGKPSPKTDPSQVSPQPLLRTRPKK